MYGMFSQEIEDFFFKYLVLEFYVCKPTIFRCFVTYNYSKS